jgi:hypothetical protein
MLGLAARGDVNALRFIGILKIVSRMENGS